MSAHSVPSPEFEVWPPVLPVDSEILQTEPGLFIHPDYTEIAIQIDKRSRDFYGLHASGIFDGIVATRRSRLQGLIRIATGHPEYGNGTINDITEGKITAAKHRSMLIIERAFMTSGEPEQLHEYGIPQDDQVRYAYGLLRANNDPIFQILEQVRSNRTSISHRDAGILVIDSLTLLRQKLLNQYSATDNGQESA